MKTHSKTAVFGGAVFLAGALVLVVKVSSDKSDETSQVLGSQALERVEEDERQLSKVRPVPFTEGRPDEVRKLSPVEAQALEVTRAATLAKMHEAAISYDPAELPVIQPYLESPDPFVRAKAVEAMIVLGDASAGAMLREAAKNRDSPTEAKRMADAADYVELPPANIKKIGEMMKKRSAERKAAKELEASKAGAQPGAAD